MKWICVGRNSAKVAAAPAALKAIVAPGYVVCVFAREGDVGGMLHLTPSTVDPASAGEAVVAQLAELSAGFEKLGCSIEGARAELVGGADVTQVHSGDTRQQLIDTQTDLIKSALAARKIWVARTRLGGTKARVVEMLLPSKSAEVTFVSRNRKPSARRREWFLQHEPDPIVVPGVGNDEVVNMGCIHVARPPVRLVAVLGSCVGVALHDPTTRLGGLAHVMMPRQDRRNGCPGKYADTAVPALIERMVDEGSQLENLRAKLVGGANVLFTRGPGVLTEIGRQNAELSRQLLSDFGIGVDWEDLGGRLGRKITVDLSDFRVVVKMLDMKELRQ